VKCCLDANILIRAVLGKRVRELLVAYGAAIVMAIGFDAYSAAEETARKRLAHRDPDDWPVLATALIFECPIWTEDMDFFGAGVATWTTDRLAMFVENVRPRG